MATHGQDAYLVLGWLRRIGLRSAGVAMNTAPRPKNWIENVTPKNRDAWAMACADVALIEAGEKPPVITKPVAVVR